MERYKIIHSIGKGGTAEVFLAEDATDMAHHLYQAGAAADPQKTVRCHHAMSA